MSIPLSEATLDGRNYASIRSAARNIGETDVVHGA
jgi:hypothetical protein